MWTIYYNDGSTFSSKSGTPQIAPGIGVQVIVQEDDRHGWEICEGDTFYVFEDRGKGAKWWKSDWAGLFDYLFNRPGYKVALLGMFIEDDDFDRIHAIAMKDPDYKKKTGYDAKERKPSGA